MSSCCAAKRRRRQMVNGHRHLAKLGRPVWHVRSAEKQQKRLQRRIQLEKLIQARKGMRMR